MTYTATREALLVHAHDLFEMMVSGAVKTTIHREYKLEDAVKAHEDFEARLTAGSSIFTL